MSNPHEGVDCENAWPQAQRGYDAIARENATLRAANAKLRAALETVARIQENGLDSSIARVQQAYDMRCVARTALLPPEDSTDAC